MFNICKKITLIIVLLYQSVHAITLPDLPDIKGDVKRENAILATMSDRPGSYSGYPQKKPANAIRLATYNVQVGPGGISGFIEWFKGNRWYYQTKMIADMLNYFNFDAIGTQELHNADLDDLAKKLKNYAWVHKEEGNTYEASGILFNINTLELIKSGYFWLNPENKSGQRAWGSAEPRNAVWAHFKHKKTGSEFILVNTHLDHISAQARIKQMEVILNSIPNLANVPIQFIVGDLNSYADDLVIQFLEDRQWRNARKYAENTFIKFDGTFNSWKETPQKNAIGETIDWIFYKSFAPKINVLPVNFAIVIRDDGKISSDHLLLFADFIIEPLNTVSHEPTT